MTTPSFRLVQATDTEPSPPTARSGDRQQRELDRISGAADPKTVSLPLGTLVPLLLDAAEHRRVWLDDFADDPVRIDADLYGVLLAYQQLRQRAA